MEEELSSTKSHSTLWHTFTKILLDNNVIVTCKQAQEVFYVASAIFKPYNGGRHKISGKTLRRNTKK